jgi:hypothetical protein
MFWRDLGYRSRRQVRTLQESPPPLYRFLKQRGLPEGPLLANLAHKKFEA